MISINGTYLTRRLYTPTVTAVVVPAGPVSPPAPAPTSSVYTLAGVDLSSFGIIAAQAPDSNLAITGHLDYPKRLGKTEHPWGDQNGAEPYVSAGEIFHGGRDIDFHFLLQAASVDAAYVKVFELFVFFDGFTDLVPLACAFGTWQVMVRDEIEVKDLGGGWCAGMIPFREPVVDLAGVIPTAPDVDIVPGIDAVSWSSLGFILVDFREIGIHSGGLKGLLNRPKPKGGDALAYFTEPYAVTKTATREYTLGGVIEAATYAELKTVVTGLYALFTQPGARVIYLNSGLIRIVYCDKGFTVNQVIVNNKATCALSITLTEGTEAEDDNWLFLGDAVGNYVVSTAGQKILIRI